MFRIPPVDGRIVFGDTEFTTLDKRRREVWEIAAIVRDPGEPDVEVEWQIRPDLTDSDPDSLRIGRYYRRNRIHDRPVGTGLIIVGPGWPELKPDDDPEQDRYTTAVDIASTLAPMLDGAYLVAAVPSADELALDRFLPQYGQAQTIHYRLRCVETLALGYLHGRRTEMANRLGPEPAPVEQIPGPPWDTKTLWRMCGVEPLPSELAHRALNDARSARAVWDAVHAE